MIRRLVLGGAAASVLLTGCGGGSGNSASSNAPTGSTRSGHEPIQLQVSKCFRAHGQPSFPDPTQDPSGNWAIPNTGGGEPKVPPPCDSLVRQMKRQGGATGSTNQPLPAGEIVKARDFAKCMREKGVTDWPDPNANGYFVLPPRLGPPNGKRLFKQQMVACKPYEPTGGAHMVLQ
ncbi:hypothetical protein AB0L06_18065 [Spirillospora sp. NPDC052269]